MTFLVNHKNPLFDEKEARLIFRMNERYLNSPFSFHEIVKSDFFFAILSDSGETVGICYILMDKLGGKEVPFYSGAAKRHHHKEIKDAHLILLNLAFEKYDEIYTWTPHLHAKIFNENVGMKKHPNIDGLYYLNKNDFLKKKGE